MPWTTCTPACAHPDPTNPLDSATHIRCTICSPAHGDQTRGRGPDRLDATLLDQERTPSVERRIQIERGATQRRAEQAAIAAREEQATPLEPARAASRAAETPAQQTHAAPNPPPAAPPRALRLSDVQSTLQWWNASLGRARARAAQRGVTIAPQPAPQPSGRPEQLAQNAQTAEPERDATPGGIFALNPERQVQERLAVVRREREEREAEQREIERWNRGAEARRDREAKAEMARRAEARRVREQRARAQLQRLRAEVQQVEGVLARLQAEREIDEDGGW
ncbi:hypothetical protein MMC17_007933 [Xylographa soralifera]|nr:hypothetical protein [Xylographa soralifera]